MNRTKKFGLIGKSLPHSESPQLFKKLFRSYRGDLTYSLFELDSIEEIESLFKDKALMGFNVTIPYKEAIIPYLDELSAIASAVGAVNTVVRSSGKWVGTNTDVEGFRRTLNLLGLRQRKQAIIFGTGGASRAVKYVLDTEGFPIQLISTKQKKDAIHYRDIDENLVASAQLIINTTPMGKFPDEEVMPYFPYHFLTRDHVVVDLNYNPPINAFLQKTSDLGCRVINGKVMLREQAKETWKIWKSELDA